MDTKKVKAELRKTLYNARKGYPTDSVEDIKTIRAACGIAEALVGRYPKITGPVREYVDTIRELYDELDQ